MIDVLNDLKLTQDTKRLENRKKRTGKVALRGRVSKLEKALFLLSQTPKNFPKHVQEYQVSMYVKQKISVF